MEPSLFPTTTWLFSTRTRLLQNFTSFKIFLLEVKLDMLRPNHRLSQASKFWSFGGLESIMMVVKMGPQALFLQQGKMSTLSTVRKALHFLENCTYSSQVGESVLQNMMANLGYEKSLSKLGQLKRPYIRREWSFFFDCITKAFANKCSNFDAIQIMSQQIGYALLNQTHFDYASVVLVNSDPHTFTTIYSDVAPIQPSTSQPPPTQPSNTQPQPTIRTYYQPAQSSQLQPSSPTIRTSPLKSKTKPTSGTSQRLHIPSVLYLEAPLANVSTPPEIPTTPILDLEPETDEVVPESPPVTHTLVLLEDDEILSSSGDSAPAIAPVSAPILGKEALLKFVEEDVLVPWEETFRGVEWTKKWNESDFIPSSHVLSEHISKADELLTNSDFKQQLKVTALSTKNLQGLHSKTHEKVDKLQESADKLDLMLKLDKNRFIRPIQEKVEAIEQVQEKQQAQLDEVLQNQASQQNQLNEIQSTQAYQQNQLNEIQSSVELLLSLLLSDDAKKGRGKGKGQGQSKQSSKVSSKKIISDSSKSSTQKNSNSEVVNAQALIASPDNQILITKSDVLIQSGSQDSQKFLKTLKLKGRETTIYYKDPKIQILDEEIAKRLFLKHNPGMDLETLKEEEARFAAEKTNPKSKASNAKKSPRPKEKGIVIKERSVTEIPRSSTRSQTTTNPKDKGKGKVGETVKKKEMKIPQILMDPMFKFVQVFDDAAVEDETVETLKRKKMTEESKTTSDIAQVVQSEDISEQQATEEFANPEQVIKTSTSDRAQVDLNKMIVADKKKLLWKNVNPSDSKRSQLLSDFMTIGLNAREARDISGLGSSEAKIKTGVEVTIKDPFLLTDKPLEEVTRKHLDKVISVQVKMVKFHDEDYRDKDIISGSRVAEFISKIVEDDGREIPMRKNSAKVEVILKGRCLYYNEDSSHPRVIRLEDGLERNHISTLRTAIYQIGSQDEELKQVKATLAQVLRNAEEKLISNFVKNHFGFRLIQYDAFTTMTVKTEKCCVDSHAVIVSIGHA
ncbi:hypothetical protein AgCh_039010 [Apium graveolens]